MSHEIRCPHCQRQIESLIEIDAPRPAMTTPQISERKIEAAYQAAIEYTFLPAELPLTDARLVHSYRELARRCLTAASLVREQAGEQWEEIEARLLAFVKANYGAHTYTRDNDMQLRVYYSGFNLTELAHFLAAAPQQSKGEAG